MGVVFYFLEILYFLTRSGPFLRFEIQAPIPNRNIFTIPLVIRYSLSYPNPYHHTSMVHFIMNETLSPLPKYVSIAARYRDQIASGVLRPGDRLPSFVEVRAQLGIGQSTLERAHELLEKESLIVREPGRGIFVAEPTRRIRTGVIGLSGIDAAKGHHPYFSALLEGVHQVAQQNGEELLLMHEDLPFTPGKVDGILLYSPAPDVALRKLPQDLPCVSLLTKARGIASVTVDDSEGIAVAVRHLIELGHKRIAYLSAFDINAPVAQLRLAAYRSTLADAGIEPLESWVRHLPDLKTFANRAVYRAFADWGFQKMNEWLATDWNSLGCTALLAHNDDTAIGAARALNKAGISVPEQVSLVGYDDTINAEMFEPPLTTVHVPLREIGQRAMELLLQEIKGDIPKGNVTPQSAFTPTLRLRTSTTVPTK
jgi:DNA-binding LacI/PurR family transcriptional regulator